MEVLIAAIALFGSIFLINGSNSSEKIENKKEAKEIAYEKKAQLENIAKVDLDWSDGIGIDRKLYDIDDEGYKTVEMSGKGTKHDPALKVKIKSINRNHIKAIVGVAIDNENYMSYFPLNRVGLKEQVPLLYAFDAKIKNPYFSSYSYSDSKQIKGCMTEPTLLIAFTNQTDISNLNFKIPDKPCGKNKKKISASFQGKANIDNINFIDELYAEKGAKIENSEINEVIISNDAIDRIGEVKIFHLETNSSFKFPTSSKLLIPNKINSQHEMYDSKYSKICNFGEVLYIGDGTLRSLDIKQGCSGIVLEGSVYNIGEIKIETGAKTQIKFKKNVQVNVKDLKLSAFTSLYFNSLAGDAANIVIKSENIKVGYENDVFMSSVIEERAGSAKMICVHPGTCLYDANKIFILSDSYVSGDTIARKLILLKNSTLNGHILATQALVKDSELSNVVKDNNDQIINPIFLSYFREQMMGKENTFLPIMKHHSMKECYSEKDCKRISANVR